MSSSVRPIRRLARLLGSFCCVVAARASVSPATGSGTETLRVAVVAPADNSHLAWVAAAHLQQAARDHGIDIAIEAASLTGTADPLPELLVMPVRSLATQVRAYQVLELPFFYPGLEAVHERLDGALGKYLADDARRHGWEVLAYWDEGMHIISGLKRYDRARNLKAREFLITRPDPVAEKQYQYWKASARRIDPEDRQAVLSECLIAGRAATLQQIVREQLYRVHLAMSLTNHRYEGWVLVAPAEHWANLDPATKEKLASVVRETTIWQRNDAQQREAAALAELKKAGMAIYEVDADEREAFRRVLPNYAELLTDELDAQQKRELIELASTGAAAVVGFGAAAPEARRDPAPGAEARQGH
ncbi:MAG: TRAP transporter substrate-binding protein DctP [Gammaproteobacteria bacterium]